jgi:hypothetical protein
MSAARQKARQPPTPRPTRLAGMLCASPPLRSPPDRPRGHRPTSPRPSPATATLADAPTPPQLAVMQPALAPFAPPFIWGGFQGGGAKVVSRASWSWGRPPEDPAPDPIPRGARSRPRLGILFLTGGESPRPPPFKSIGGASPPRTPPFWFLVFGLKTAPKTKNQSFYNRC